MLQMCTLSIWQWRSPNLCSHGTYRNYMSDNGDKGDEKHEVLGREAWWQGTLPERCPPRKPSLINLLRLFCASDQSPHRICGKHFPLVLPQALPSPVVFSPACDQSTRTAAVTKPWPSLAGRGASRWQLLSLPRLGQCHLLSVPRQQVLHAGQQI